MRLTQPMVTLLSAITALPATCAGVEQTGFYLQDLIELIRKIWLRIPRHPDTQPTHIRTLVPRSFGQAVGAQRRRGGIVSLRCPGVVNFGVRLRIDSPFRFDPISVVHQAVEDGVGQGRVADQLVPVVHRHLAGNDGRALAVAVVQ